MCQCTCIRAAAEFTLRIFTLQTFHEPGYIRRPRNGCISLHVQPRLLGSKFIFFKVPCQTSSISLCFVYYICYLKIYCRQAFYVFRFPYRAEILIFTGKERWKRNEEMFLQQYFVCKGVTEYFMRITSDSRSVYRNKICHTQLLYNGCSIYHIVRSHVLHASHCSLHYHCVCNKRSTVSALGPGMWSYYLGYVTISSSKYFTVFYYYFMLFISVH
jgi:hypothetical protein